MGLGALRERVTTWRLWQSLNRPGPPPSNVRVVGPGSVQTPVSCTYDGFYQGLHHWRALAPPGPIYGVTFDGLHDCAAIVVSRADPEKRPHPHRR